MDWQESATLDDDANNPLQVPLSQLPQLPQPSDTDKLICREIYHLSLLESLDPHAHRLLMHGPSQSGMSSLLMDLACSLASQTPCRCVSEQSQQQQHCRCTAVLILRPASTNMEQDHFPVPCQRVNSNNSCNNNHEINSSISTSARKSSTFPLSLLHRIQVHHFEAVRDLYTLLLQLQGLSPSKQPWGGILVDDVDRIVGCGTANMTGATSPMLGTPRLSQLLAVLVDTVNVLHRLKRPVDATPVRLAVASHESLIGGSSSSSSNNNKMTHFWNPCCVELQPVMSPLSSSATLPAHLNHSSAGFSAGTVAVRNFRAAVTAGASGQSSSSSSSSLTTDRPGHHISYAILRSMDEGGRIVWAVNE